MARWGLMAAVTTASRCAVHPARPAVDACPVCERRRCAADAASYGDRGCPACATAGTITGPPSPSALERVVRAALAALGAALLGGLVAAQYVDAELFAYLTPLVVGAACGAAAQAAAGTGRALARRPPAGRVRSAGAVGGVLAVGIGFLLEGSTDPLSVDAVVPVALAVAGALLWTLPPRHRR